MDWAAIAEWAAMDGFALWIWASYGVCLLLFFLLWIDSRRSLARRERALDDGPATVAETPKSSAPPTFEPAPSEPR